MKEVEILIDVLDKKAKALKALNKFEFLGSKKVLDIYFYFILYLILPSQI